MNVHASQILERFLDRGLISSLKGSDQLFLRLSPIEECRPGDLVFIDHPKYLAQVRAQQPAGVVTTGEIAEQLVDVSGLAILISPNVRLAMAILKQTYADRDVRETEWPRIHPSAVIHDSVSIPDDVLVGPGVVLGRGVKVGAGVVFMANVVVEHDAVIGS